MKPCLTCGEPAAATRCDECSPRDWSDVDARRGTYRERGYTAAFDRLSKRARKLQPFCSDCGTQDDLTTDHLPIAWERQNAGKTIRLKDVDVVCVGCNVRRGSSRPGTARATAQGWGEARDKTFPEPRGKAQGPLYTTRRSSSRALHGHSAARRLLVGVKWLLNALPSVRRVCESAISHADCQRPVVLDCDGGGFGVGLDGAIREFDCGFHARSMA